jgi:hypothetical protein
MQATRSGAARDGKKADDGTMISHPDVNPITAADPAAAQTFTPATMT